jgi:hypothetical protein
LNIFTYYRNFFSHNCTSLNFSYAKDFTSHENGASET